MYRKPVQAVTISAEIGSNLEIIHVTPRTNFREETFNNKLSESVGVDLALRKLASKRNVDSSVHNMIMCVQSIALFADGPMHPVTSLQFYLFIYFIYLK